MIEPLDPIPEEVNRVVKRYELAAQDRLIRQVELGHARFVLVQERVAEHKVRMPAAMWEAMKATGHGTPCACTRDVLCWSCIAKYDAPVAVQEPDESDDEHFARKWRVR